MTPLEIEILFHYRCRADDYRNGDHSAPAVKEAIGRFLDDELLIHHGFAVARFESGTIKARYATTPRTCVYLDFLCSVPLPIQKWIMPRLTEGLT